MASTTEHTDEEPTAVPEGTDAAPTEPVAEGAEETPDDAASAEAGTADDEPTTADEGDAPSEATAEAAPRPSTSSTSKKGRRTAGERLAAARAAKAAAKAAERGRTAEAVESKAEARAAQATSWLRERTQLLLGVAVAALVVVGGVAFWRGQSESAAAAKTESLRDAIATSRAPIRPEDAPDEALPTGETYASVTARAEKAFAAFGDVDPAGTAGAWGQLGQGASALTLGKPEDARKAFESALSTAGDDPVIAWRALEGIVFSYEAEQKWDEALGRLEELTSTAGGAYAAIASYHAARLRLAKGDRTQARTDLQELLNELPAAGGRPGPDERGGEPELAYVRREAQRLLDALGGAPDANPAAAAEGVRRALEQLRTKTSPGAGEVP